MSGRPVIAENENLRILIGLLPCGADKNNLAQEFERELDSIKAALTYGDEVNSSSLVLQTVKASQTILRCKSIDGRALLPALARFLLVLRNDYNVRPALKRITELNQRHGDFSEGELNDIRNLAEAFHAPAKLILEELDAAEFEDLCDNECFYLQDCRIATSVEEVAKEFLDWILVRLKRNSTYPVLDGRFAKEVLALDRLSRPAGNKETALRAVEMALQDRLITALPYVKEATASECVELRTQLRPALLDFRAAISKLTRSIDAQSWEEGLDNEIERIKREELAPACRELHCEFAKNKFVSNLLNRTLVSPPALASNGFLASGLTGVGFLVPAIAPLDMNALVPAVSAAFGVSASSATAIRDTMKRNRELKKSPYFFFHRLSVFPKSK